MFFNWKFFGCLALSTLIFITRVLPHGANWTPVLALCLLCGMIAKGHWYGLVLPLLAFSGSEFLLPDNPAWGLTLIPMILLILLGQKMKNNLFSLGAIGFLGSVLFFVVSNFGVWWLTDMYPRDWAGLGQCFLSALPFFRGTLASTIAGLYVFHFLAEIYLIKIALRVPERK